MTTLATEPQSTFHFPSIYTSYPPFFTLQPTASTRQSQLLKWSNLIQRYCRHHRLFQLSLSSAQDTPLFRNATLNKRLQTKDIREVISFMAGAEGGGRAEWFPAGRGESSDRAWIYWRTPVEWAAMVAGWVEETGQRGSVLTLYEIVDSEATRSQEFYEMDVEVLRRGLAALAKQGKCQVFGGEGQEGVKFF